MHEQTALTMNANVRSNRVSVSAGVRSFNMPYTMTPSDEAFYKLLSGPREALLQWKSQKILEEQEGHQWSLMSRSKYPLNLAAAEVVKCEVESAMEQTRVDAQRQLVRLCGCLFLALSLV